MQGLGSCGDANGGLGWSDSDFELPLWFFGTKRWPGADYGELPDGTSPRLPSSFCLSSSSSFLNHHVFCSPLDSCQFILFESILLLTIYHLGEKGLVGDLCTKANGYDNCATLTSLTDRTPRYAHGDGPSPGFSVHNQVSSPCVRSPTRLFPSHTFPSFFIVYHFSSLDRRPTYYICYCVTADRVLSPPTQTTFYEWFHKTPRNIEIPFNLSLDLVPGTSRTYTYVLLFVFSLFTPFPASATPSPSYFIIAA